MASTSTLQQPASAYTAGPWEVADNGVAVVASALKGRVRFTGNDGKEHEAEQGLVALVYACHADGDYQTGTCEANRNLIAAAPELLEALRVILRGFEQGLFVRDVTRDADASWAIRLIPFVRVLQQAQAAIAKAEGGTR